MIVSVEDHPDVVALIPTLGLDPDRLDECLAALRRQDADTRLAVAVVFNAEGPAPELTGVTSLVAGLNLGWGGGLAYGRSRIGDPGILWLVQDDMVPADDCLRHLLDGLDEHAAVSPVAVDRDGLTVPFGSGGFLGPDGDIVQWYPSSNVRPEDLITVDGMGYVASRGLLVRREAWDGVGGMDPGYYPAMFADVSFCDALRTAGRTFALVPAAHTRHQQNGSTRRPYAEFLYALNRERFLASRRGATPAAAEASISTAVLSSVAVGASGVLQALAGRYTTLTGEYTALNEEIENLRVIAWRVEQLEDEVRALRSSTSWRITAPLRALATGISSVRRR